MNMYSNHNTTACLFDVCECCVNVCIIASDVNRLACDVHMKCIYMKVAGIPAEFKHIDKRRRSYNTEYCQSLRMNTVYIIVEIADSFIEMSHRMFCQ